MKIVIIEDSEKIRSELKVFLEKYGYTVACVEDFENAVQAALKEEPHLILLDINLPAYDGYYICKELRRVSSVPIIVVTSRDSDADELMSMHFGADDFITKPYNTQILLARICALLNRTYKNQAGMQYSYNGVTIHLSKSTISCGDMETELTKNELRILNLLMRAGGEITARDDIMDALWQSNEFVDDNTLTVNINRLRKNWKRLARQTILKPKEGGDTAYEREGFFKEQDCGYLYAVGGGLFYWYVPVGIQYEHAGGPVCQYGVFVCTGGGAFYRIFPETPLLYRCKKRPCAAG